MTILNVQFSNLSPTLFAVGRVDEAFYRCRALFALPKTFNSIKLMANSFLHLFAARKESSQSGCDYKTSTEFIMQIVQVQFMQSTAVFSFSPSRVISITRDEAKSKPWRNLGNFFADDVLMGNYAN
jgi:hypothetical protein